MSGISSPGNGVNVLPNGSFVVGSSSSTSGTGDYAVVLGSFATANTYGTALGGGSVADGQGAAALGFNSLAHATDSTAVGGGLVNSTADQGVSIGNSSTVAAGASGAIAAGKSTQIGTNASGSVAIGQSAIVAAAAARSVAAGYNTTANHADAVALGTGAATGEQYDIALGVVPNGSTTHSHVSVNGEYLRFGYKNASGADPAAPASGKALLYFRDNGAGKGQLVVRFPTGAVQVLATEP